MGAAETELPGLVKSIKGSGGTVKSPGLGGKNQSVVGIKGKSYSSDRRRVL